MKGKLFAPPYKLLGGVTAPDSHHYIEEGPSSSLSSNEILSSNEYFWTQGISLLLLFQEITVDEDK